MAIRKRDLKSVAAPLSRRDILHAGSILVPVAFVPGLAFRSAVAATTAIFDYYISSTGSDSNPGTQASPWAITAINTKRSTYAGKKVGLLDGTYNIHSLCQAGNGDGYSCILSMNGAGGSSSAQTVIQAVNRGAAVIDCGGTTVNNPALGTSDGTTSYLTIDGLKIINGGSKLIHLGLYTGTNLDIPGWVVQNCEFTKQNCYNVGGGATANNYSCIELQGGLGSVIRNNYFHGNIGNAGPTNGNHYSATIQWYTRNALYEYNTCLGPGLYGKEGGNSGTTIRFNYVDNTGWTGVGGIGDFVGASKTATGTATTIHHNVLIATGNDMRPTLGGGNYLPDPLFCYNNTFIVLNSAQSSGFMIDIDSGKATFYNNITYSNATGDMDLMCVNVDGPGVWDYNLYYSSTGSYTYGTFSSKTSGVRNGSSTLAAWKSLMSVPCEAHAVDRSNPLFVGTGTLADRYKLQSGSPAKSAGTTTGKSTGTACDIGAWGNGAPTLIGSSIAAGGSTNPLPQAPTLSVS